jgi:hypothetical protein
MALVKISELPATTTVLSTQEIPTNNAGVNEKITIGQLANGSVYSITTNYNGSTTDGYTRIHFNHSATTKKITYLFPAVAASIGRAILFQNLDTGLSVLDGNGANIILGNNTLTSLKLIMKGDICIARSNGTVWIVEHANINIQTNMISCSDWANAYRGSAFTYDAKSAAVDLSGQHITGTNNAALILYDSGGTGNSGILYICNQSGSDNGVWANNEVVTCGSGGYTCLVNEGSGSSKNIDYNFYHGLGINDSWFELRKMISSDGTYGNSFNISMESADQKSTATNFGQSTFPVDTNFVAWWMDSNGFTSEGETPAYITMAAQDYFYNIHLKLRI